MEGSLTCNSASHWSCELRSRSALLPQRGKAETMGYRLRYKFSVSEPFKLLWPKPTLYGTYGDIELWEPGTSWEPGSRGSRISTRRELQELSDWMWLPERMSRGCMCLATVLTVFIRVALGAVDGVAYWTALKRPVLQFFKGKLFLR